VSYYLLLALQAVLIMQHMAHMLTVEIKSPRAWLTGSQVDPASMFPDSMPGIPESSAPLTFSEQNTTPDDIHYHCPRHMHDGLYPAP
jgi:hypothetical protein